MASPIRHAKTFEILMILQVWCAERATPKQIDATPDATEAISDAFGDLHHAGRQRQAGCAPGPIEEAPTGAPRADSLGALPRFTQWAFAATMRGSNTNRFGLVGSILALTQWVFLAPNVSTRVKFASTPPDGPLSGLSTLK